jgi:hypothetical protein
MARVDSVDKIVSSYFAVLANTSFVYKQKQYLPKPLKISSLLLRDYTCPVNCGGCCPRFSLDYLPSNNNLPYPLKRRVIEFDGHDVSILSDMQEDHKNHHCRNLEMSDGRCKIHKKRPFSCDFELIRPSIFEDKNTPNMITSRLFGRGWNMLRIDGKRGALCVMTPITDASIEDVIRKIKILNEWCSHFGLADNKCNSILRWIDSIRSFVKFYSIPHIIIEK